ncbi:MAG: PEP-CTERM sorting domain-containing protein [Phycisphaeraceae bacterium]
MISKFMRVAAFVAALILVTSVSQAAILAVDFNGGSPTQAGFVQQADNNETFGSSTVQTSVNDFFDRSNLNSIAQPGAVFTDLYRDFIYNNQADGFINFTVSGLTPSTSYVVTVYAFDFETGATAPVVTFLPTPSTATTGTSSFVAYTPNAAPTTQHQYSTDLVLTSTTDVLSFTALANVSASLRVNGFEINAVPEPASLVLLGIGGLFLLRRRR